MANRKISDLTALTAPATGDLLPIVDISEAAAADKNKKITIGELFASIPAGTAAAPSVAFEGDSNTGIYSPGADQVAISTNGDERLRIDSSGSLLVGTSSARSNFFNSTNSARLQIEGSGSNDNYALSIVSNYAGSTNGAHVILAKSGGSNVGDNTLVSNGNTIGQISFQGADGTEFVPAASIASEVDGTPGANDMPGCLVFSTTADGASGPTERMRITSAGEINCGYTGSSTGYKINISKDGSALLVLDENSGNSGSRILSTWRTGTYSSSDVSSSFLYFQRGDGTNVGSIVRNGTNAVAYVTSSDYRLKENVVSLTGAVNRLLQLQVRQFNFIDDPDKIVDGFIAHEAQEVVPECVTGEKDAVDADGNPVYQGIDQSKLVPLLTAALQEAIAKIETLEARLTAAGIE